MKYIVRYARHAPIRTLHARASSYTCDKPALLDIILSMVADFACTLHAPTGLSLLICCLELHVNMPCRLVTRCHPTSLPCWTIHCLRSGHSALLTSQHALPPCHQVPSDKPALLDDTLSVIAEFACSIR